MLFPGFGPSSIATSKSATAGQIDHDLFLVIEAGGSMHAPDRWDGVLESVKQLSLALEELPNRIRVGLVICHNKPFVAMQLGEGDVVVTLERIEEVIDDIKLRQGRNLGGGLQLASDLLEREKGRGSVADQTIVFLGNGHHTKGTHPVDAANSAAARHQRIHCLTFGNNADKNGDMAMAARITGGESMQVRDLALIPDILEGILVNQSIVLIQ